MTVFEEIVDSIVEFFSSMMDNFACRFHNWQMRRDYVKEKKKYKDALIGSEIQYEPEEPDKHLALRIVSYLEYKFPNGIQNHLLQLSVDERKKLMNEIVEDAARLFDVEPVAAMEYMATERLRHSLVFDAKEEEDDGKNEDDTDIEF